MVANVLGFNSHPTAESVQLQPCMQGPPADPPPPARKLYFFGAFILLLDTVKVHSTAPGTGGFLQVAAVTDAARTGFGCSVDAREYTCM